MLNILFEFTTLNCIKLLKFFYAYCILLEFLLEASVPNFFFKLFYCLNIIFENS